MTNKQILLKSRPSGWVTPDNFELSESDIPVPAKGQMLLQAIYMSVDPYMRGRMNDVKSYIPPFQIGKPCQAGIVGKVIASNDGPYTEGTYLSGMGDWANYTVTDGEGFQPVLAGLVPLSYYLGLFGMPGMTAYVGLKGVAELKDGEQLFVSAASGAVGQVVGQIGKNMGCHVVGSAGSDEKIAYLKDELGFDGGINYKSDNLQRQMAEANPKGIDVNFENVGGPILEAVISNMNMNGRMALCGMISNYNAASMDDLPPGPRNMAILVGRSVRMQGFIVFNYPDLCKEWIEVGSAWLTEGKLKYRESIAEGIENAPQAFIDMLQGKNFGKQVVRLADD